MTPRVLGAVLAGGQSRRFGTDKASALLDGRTLLDHVIAALAPQVDAIVICGRLHPTLPAIVDRPAPDLGPLGGLNAALHYGEANGFDLVLTVGCDMPGFRADVLSTLLSHEPAVLLGQRIIGLWPVSLSARLDEHLASCTDRSIRGWMRAVQTADVPFTGAIANVNTPADLARLAQQTR